VLVGVVCLALAGSALAAEIGNAGDDLRTGWYPDEGSLTPQLVSGNTFGQLWSTTVDGQVYAQPLFSPAGTSNSPSGLLLVATENDKVYALDPANGAQQWMTDLGQPWNPGDIGCSDIEPSIGTTSTPVIDTATNTVYLTHKTYANGSSGAAEWFMDALDIATGKEKPGWPVQLSGTDDTGQITFFPRTQQQRPGLLLMNGVVYAAFGSHCDVQPWQGWVFGVSTTTHQITTRWVDDTTGNGAGIWQAGTALASDGPGQILFTTGNGGAPSSPKPGSAVPSACGECVMRLQVQSNGTLKAVDFFAPYDAASLDQSDSDFGSGGLVGLPDQYFGTSALPHLAVTVGKEGIVYLLNRDHLGGFEQGSGGGDDVVQNVGTRGGVWGRPGVWPGDGGYVYTVTSTGSNGGGRFDVYKYGLSGSGGPSLSLAASSPDVFGWGSGSPVITSDGTNPGSAVVWTIWSSDRQGDGGQLRAYSAVPVNGGLNPLFSASIGHATNYTSPGVAGGQVYVGTRDGKVLAFGSPTPQPLAGSGVSFPPTVDGTSSNPQTLTMKASRTVTVSNLDASPSEFSLGTPSKPLPATLNAGETLSVPVTFTPGGNDTGPIAGQLTASTTDAGDVSFSLSGTGEAPAGELQSNPADFLSLGGTAIGSELTGTVTFSNVGAGPLTVSGFDAPSPTGPFSASNAPAANDTIASVASVTVDISFVSQSPGQYTDAITLNTTDGESQTVQLSASASTPGRLQFSTQAVDFGNVAVGSTASRTFTISNVGGTTVTINKSKPPFGGAFGASTSLPEGTAIAPGQTVTETVTFTPTSAGPASAAWLITGNDVTGPQQVQFSGVGTAVASSAGGSPSPGGPPPQTAGSGGPGTTVAPLPPPHAPRFVPARVRANRVSGLYVTYTARVSGVSRFVLERAAPGRRTAHGCVPVTAHNRSLRPCTRFVLVRTFTHRDNIGAARLRLTAYVRARQLRAGTYRLRSVLLDAAGHKYTLSTGLRILAAPARQPSRRAAPKRAAEVWIGTALADVLRQLTVLL
jgi:iron transport multicopper oxidase